MHAELQQDPPDSMVLLALAQAWPPQVWVEVHVAIAISGGCDSMALLRAVREIKKQRGGAGQVTAIHVNHRLRGAESDEDAAWCQEQCEMLGVPLKILRGEVTERARLEGDGLEAAARSRRYELLTQAAEQVGARYLATAHTQNDQVETVLFRLLRGSGLQGLRGIPRTRPLTLAVTLIRPLLACPRTLLEKYLAELQQSFRSDSSNEQLRFTRNRLRHELLPQLRKDFNQEVDASLLRLASQADETQRFIELRARMLLEASACTEVASGELALALGPLSQQPDVVVCEALRLAWREAGLSEQAMTYAWWRKLAGLAKGTCSEDVFHLPGKVHASTSGGRLILRW